MSIWLQKSALIQPRTGLGKSDVSGGQSALHSRRGQAHADRRVPPAEGQRREGGGPGEKLPAHAALSPVGTGKRTKEWIE